MNKIKIIEGMAPWAVMKAASEGKRVAAREKSDWFTDPWADVKNPHWNWARKEYAIIDDSRPVIDWDGFDWDGFDWEFFNVAGRRGRPGNLYLGQRHSAITR